MENTQDFYEKGWRLSVGIVLFNSEKNIFMGERIDNKGAWQMPQGGVELNKNECLLNASVFIGCLIFSRFFLAAL